MRARLHRLLPFAAAFALAAFAAAPAHAQLADQLEFQTGFSFVVGNRVMPAGHYTIQRVWGDPFLFEVTGPKTAVLEVHDAGAPPAVGARQDEVLFRRFGKELVMSEVWDADTSSGVQLAVRYKGEAMARNDTAPVVVVASR
jgi:hypothetical protein